MPQNTPLLLLVSTVIGLISSFLAYRSGRNPYFWFFIGMIFGLFGVMAMFLAPKPKKQEEPKITPEPQPYIEGPLDRFWYYLSKEREQQGPMSYDALTQAWKKGEIAPSTLVWHEELTNWKQLQDLIKYKE